MFKDNYGHATTATDKYNDFINKLAKSYGKDPEEVEQWAIVQEYRDWIRKELG